MTDICKCRGDGCTKKDLCYRYTCEHDPLYQAYFANTPSSDGDCEYFWQRTPTEPPEKD